MGSCSLVSDLEIPKTHLDNLRWRHELLRRCEDLTYRAMVREAFRRDILFAFNAFFVTNDPRLPGEKDLPMATWPFQDEHILTLNESIENQEDILTEKSRDMSATWDVLGVFFYRWLVHHETFLIGSRLAELVDKFGDPSTHFERLRKLISYMPDWLMPIGWHKPTHDNHLRLINPEGGNAIVGQAMTKDFGRQGRYKAILLDEFAFCEDPSETWQATADSSRCRMPVSTPSPEGMANFFAMLRFSGRIKVSTLHWSKHPLKTQEWYEKEKARRRPEEVARELDIDYEGSAAHRTVIPAKWCREAQQNTQRLGPAFKVVSADIARFGDDRTIIYRMDGYKIVGIKILQGASTMEAAGIIKREVEEFGANIAIVDVVGLGAGVVDRLTEQGVPVMPFNGGEKSSNPERYKNLRAEAYWMMGEVYRDGQASDPVDDELLVEISAHQYTTDSSGKIQIESKDEIKSRLGRSPDKADARAMGTWAMRAMDAFAKVAEMQKRTSAIVTAEEIGFGPPVSIGVPI